MRQEIPFQTRTYRRLTQGRRRTTSPASPINIQNKPTFQANTNPKNETSINITSINFNSVRFCANNYNRIRWSPSVWRSPLRCTLNSNTKADNGYSYRVQHCSFPTRVNVQTPPPIQPVSVIHQHFSVPQHRVLSIIAVHLPIRKPHIVMLNLYVRKPVLLYLRFRV